jgi:hypothetical protein
MTSIRQTARRPSGIWKWNAIGCLFYAALAYGTFDSDLPIWSFAFALMSLLCGWVAFNALREK